ncbi:methylated-DNA--cysteine S-met [Ceratobasidium sp. AG-I]|nr:methylated-DNA--cysteine S-met [Ceratobasidium sp. AG-I]
MVPLLDPVHFPSDFTERELFRTSAGKKVTAHQWAVYDYILTIPLGRISTYKSVCDALGQGSPRSVGSALKNNPFAPYIPCHRIIASNLYLGGYCGEWGPQAKTGTQFNHKLKILSDEGVAFDSRGMLQSQECLWTPEYV